MNEDRNKILRKTRQWIQFADEDLRLAEHGLTLSTSIPYRLIAFHAQQCAEKYLKAFLVLREIEFPYTHNLTRLLELCTLVSDVKERLIIVEELGPFAVTTRYPGEDEEVTHEEAIHAIQVAKDVREIFRIQLLSEGIEL